MQVSRYYFGLPLQKQLALLFGKLLCAKNFLKLTIHAELLSLGQHFEEGMPLALPTSRNESPVTEIPKPGAASKRALAARPSVLKKAKKRFFSRSVSSLREAFSEMVLHTRNPEKRQSTL
jgi:hypothetical protein